MMQARRGTAAASLLLPALTIMSVCVCCASFAALAHEKRGGVVAVVGTGHGTSEARCRPWQRGPSCVCTRVVLCTRVKRDVYLEVDRRGMLGSLFSSDRQPPSLRPSAFP